MAKDNLNLGKDSDADEKSGGKGKLIIIIAAVLLLAGGGAAFFLLGSGGPEDGAAEEVAEAPPEPVPTEPIYLPMEKVLVNLEYGGRTHYVQAEMQLKSFYQEVVDQATRDMPAIRNKMIFLFNSQDFAALKTVEGKEALRTAALAAVNEELGLEEPKVIADLYFDTFVLQ